MFDFLMTEAFWIKTIIAVLLTGIFAVFVIGIALTPMLQRIFDQLTANENELRRMYGNTLNEHIGLSKEHWDIGAASPVELEEIRRGITSVAQELRMLRDEQLQAKIYAESRQQALMSKQLDIQHTVEQIKALNDEVARLQLQNQWLMQKEALLEQKNDCLQQRLERTRRQSPADRAQRNNLHEQEDDRGMEP